MADEPSPSARHGSRAVLHRADLADGAGFPAMVHRRTLCHDRLVVT
jgi:hypothetical protein